VPCLGAVCAGGVLLQQLRRPRWRPLTAASRRSSSNSCSAGLPAVAAARCQAAGSCQGICFCRLLCCCSSRRPARGSQLLPGSRQLGRLHGGGVKCGVPLPQRSNAASRLCCSCAPARLPHGAAAGLRRLRGSRCSSCLQMLLLQQQQRPDQGFAEQPPLAHESVDAESRPPAASACCCRCSHRAGSPAAASLTVILFLILCPLPFSCSGCWTRWAASRSSSSSCRRLLAQLLQEGCWDGAADRPPAVAHTKDGREGVA
jgi:hypothetical protein